MREDEERASREAIDEYGTEKKAVGHGGIKARGNIREPFGIMYVYIASVGRIRVVSTSLRY